MLVKRSAVRVTITAIAGLAVISALLGANFLLSPSAATGPASTQDQTSSGSASSSSPQSTLTTQTSSGTVTTDGAQATTPAATSSLSSSGGGTSSSTATGSSSTQSCTSSTPALIQTAFSNDSSTLNPVSLFASFSKMSVSWHEVSSGTLYVSQTFTVYDTSVVGEESVAESYSVVYSSPTAYKVQISESQSGGGLDATAWFLKDGTLVAYDFLGQNMTGSMASGLVQGLMSPFFYQAEYTALVQTLTSQSGVKATGEGATTIGSTTVALTNYTSTSAPFTVAICGGSLMVSQLSLQTGTVQGAGIQLLMALTISGSETYHGQTNQIVSLSVLLTSVQSAKY